MWKVEYTKRFLKELSKIPSKIQYRAEKIVFDELTRSNPFELGYVEQMKGYANKYKIRVGQYRIGITILRKEQVLICQRIAHRKTIYNIFP